MGQRMLELDLSYTGNKDGSAVLHVSQMPPNPSIFPPGPARESPLLPQCYNLSLTLDVTQQSPSSS